VIPALFIRTSIFPLSFKIFLQIFLNKVIVITGAGRGIGNFLASELSKRSAIVYGVDKTFSNKNKKNVYFQKKCDITNKTQFKKICKNILKDNGKIDVLINNAGITLPNNSSNQ
jgi:hypothetical protein